MKRYDIFICLRTKRTGVHSYAIRIRMTNDFGFSYFARRKNRTIETDRVYYSVSSSFDVDR